MTMALYTFTTYFEHTNFLYHVVDFNDQEIDYHGAFYCGLVSTILNAVAAIIILLDDSITKASKQTQMLMRAARGDVDPTKLQALYEEFAQRQYYTNAAFTPDAFETCSGFAKNDVHVSTHSQLADGAPSSEGPIIRDGLKMDGFYSQMVPYPDEPPPYAEANDSFQFTEAYGDQGYSDELPENQYADFNYDWDNTDFLHDTIVEEEFVPMPHQEENASFSI